MTLKELLGEELFAQVDAKIQEHNNGQEDKKKHVRFVDLSEGNYVSKEKHTALEQKAEGFRMEAEGYKAQLGEANTTIQSYKDMDIDGIKKSAADWETKYNTDTKALQDKLDAQATEFAAEKYMGQFQFTSPLVAKAAMAEFMAQGFKRSEDGTFLGADDFMTKMKENNPGAFVVETPPTDPEPPKPPKPTFTPGTDPTPPGGKKKMSLTEAMKYKNEHPEADITTLLE